MRKILLTLSVILLSLPAGATSTMELNLSELAQKADAIVVGHAVSRESFWRDGRIMTRVLVNADEVWSGNVAAGDTVEVLTLGGAVDDVAQRVDGAPVLRVGERLALMVAKDAMGAFHPMGLWQGVFRVNGDGKQAPIKRDSGTALRVISGTGTLSRALSVTPATLDALRTLVQEAVRASR
jgi:hypothetical protein